MAGLLTCRFWTERKRGRENSLLSSQKRKREKKKKERKIPSFRHVILAKKYSYVFEQYDRSFVYKFPLVRIIRIPAGDLKPPGENGALRFSFFLRSIFVQTSYTRVCTWIQSVPVPTFESRNTLIVRSIVVIVPRLFSRGRCGWMTQPWREYR